MGRGAEANACEEQWREPGPISFSRTLQGPILFRAEMEKRGVLFFISGDLRGRARAGGSRTGSSLSTASAGCLGGLFGEVWTLKVISYSALAPLGTG